MCSIMSEGDFSNLPGGGSEGAAGGMLGYAGGMPTYQMCEFVSKPQGGVFNEGTTVEMVANVSGAFCESPL